MTGRFDFRCMCSHVFAHTDRIVCMRAAGFGDCAIEVAPRRLATKVCAADNRVVTGRDQAPAGIPLPARTERVLAALVPVVCPPIAVQLGLTEAIVHHVGLQLGSFPPMVRRGFVVGAAAYDQSARARIRHLGRAAHELSPAQQRDHFQAWWHGPTPLHRQWADVAKRLLAMACYEQPQMLARIGYTPQAWVDHVAKRRLTQYRPAIEEAAHRVLAPDPLPTRMAEALPEAPPPGSRR